MSGLFLVSAMPSYTQNCIPRLKELLTISKVIINSYDSTSNSVITLRGTKILHITKVQVPA
jgi:hypothetical protein